jgi:hypothetical protein
MACWLQAMAQAAATIMLLRFLLDKTFWFHNVRGCTPSAPWDKLGLEPLWVTLFVMASLAGSCLHLHWMFGVQII